MDIAIGARGRDGASHGVPTRLRQGHVRDGDDAAGHNGISTGEGEGSQVGEEGFIVLTTARIRQRLNSRQGRRGSPAIYGSAIEVACRHQWYRHLWVPALEQHP